MNECSSTPTPQAKDVGFKALFDKVNKSVAGVIILYITYATISSEQRQNANNMH